jgi:cytoskeletal protein CcmA (bactofilin family)
MKTDKNRRMMDNINRFTTVVGAGTTIEGKFSGDDNYIINGTITGDCNITGSLVVSETGKVQGIVRASIAIISGHVEGDLYIGDKLELRATGHVAGSIFCNRIAMAEGSVHEGELHMDAGAQLGRYVERRGQGDSPSAV